MTRDFRGSGRAGRRGPAPAVRTQATRSRGSAGGRASPGQASPGQASAGRAAGGGRPGSGTYTSPGGRAGTGYASRGYASRGYAGGGSVRNGGRRPAPGRRRGSWWRHWTLKKAVVVFLGLCGALAAAAVIMLAVAYAETPIPTDVSALALQQSSTVYFSNGKTVVGKFGTADRQVLSSAQIPVQLKNAVIAAEDRNFYHEGGISPTGILRAAFDDVTGSGGTLQGGSTITQQFVRNYYANIGTQQTISRKLKEIFVAIKLARQKSKDWILTQYLNTIYFGDGAYGVGAAAQTYFGKPATRLDVAQDAMIAAMLNAPGAFDPVPGTAGYKPLVARWRYVLQGMVTMGKLSPQQAAAQTFPRVAPTRPGSSGWTGYKGYIMQAVQNELRHLYHYTIPEIDNDGLRIVTTFSKPMMDALYATVSESEKQMRANGAPLPRYAHVGAVLEQPGTGAIVAMYSGPSYSARERHCRQIDCQEDMALQNREQVGSSFKPYVLATARAQGMSVKASILNGTSPLWIPPDSQPDTTASASSQPPPWYEVINDSDESLGPVSVVTATAQSVNTAYTDLTHRVGTQNVINMAKSFGVNTGPYPQGSGLQGQVHQVGIALGTAALTVEEQANTFASLAAGGEYVTPHVIRQVTRDGTPVPSPLARRQVLTPDEAADVDYALSFDTINGTGTAAAMTDGRPIIGKTGTTETAQSAFFLGAIPQYSLAIGMFTNNQNASTGPGAQTLNGVGGLAGYGGNWPAMIWHSFAEKEFAPLPIEQFPTPGFGGSPWNLVGPGASLYTPRPHPTASPSRPAPSPSPSCNPAPGAPCGNQYPPTTPPVAPSPIPTGPTQPTPPHRKKSAGAAATPAARSG